MAVRGASTNGDLWIQAYVTADEPRDYDDPLQEANTLGQLNSWADATVVNYDGMMSAKAKAGSNHKDGVMKWKATQSGTMYFALKVGTQKNQFSYSFDNFSFIDLTPAGIEAPQADEALYQLTDGVLTLGRGSRVYNMNGVQEAAGQMKPGMYIITDGIRQQKVMF